ncbi:MAG: hypothetical protein KJN73_02855 [Acidimicrobiia bacterium]|nr:hypothetical protein [Acidimicrobiia bacterium]
MAGTSRVGVAVDPPLLADLLVRLLGTSERRVQRYNGRGLANLDLAVISPAFEDALVAPVVIRLPGDHGDSGVGIVTTDGRDDPVVISDVDVLFRVIGRHLSAAIDR